MSSQPSARSPLSGCAILIAAVVVLVFLIGFSVTTLFRQATEIEKFTQTSRTPVAEVSAEGNETSAAELVRRLEAFRAAVTKGTEEARLELGAEDLNLAIAIAPALKDLRGSFHVREIRDGKLVIDICYQMNGRPRMTRQDEAGMVTWDMRYLNGTIYGRPELQRREVVLKVDQLDVPGAAVPEGFMEHFSTLRIFEASVNDHEIGPVMGALTEVSLAGDRMVLARVPGAPLPGVITDEQFTSGGGRLVRILGIGACVFLVFAGIMIFIGLRAQRRKDQERDSLQDSGEA